jgi:hypothetical protein
MCYKTAYHLEERIDIIAEAMAQDMNGGARKLMNLRVPPVSAGQNAVQKLIKNRNGLRLGARRLKVILVIRHQTLQPGAER